MLMRLRVVNLMVATGLIFLPPGRAGSEDQASIRAVLHAAADADAGRMRIGRLSCLFGEQLSWNPSHQASEVCINLEPAWLSRVRMLRQDRGTVEIFMGNSDTCS